MIPLPRLRDLWVNRPEIDYLISAVVGLGAFLIDPNPGLRAQDHGSFHQTLATVNGVLLTLGTIVITLVFTVTPNERLQWVTQRVGLGLQRLVMRCLGGLIISTIGFCGLFLLEDGVDSRWRVTATAVLVAFAALRFLRLWWLLSRILETLAAGSAQGQVDVTPWQSPLLKPGDYHLRRRKPQTKAE